MQKKKPVRKYSTAQRIAILTKYGTQQAIAGSLAITLILLFMLFMLLSIFLFSGLLVLFFIFVFTRFQEGFADILGCGIVFCFVASITFGLAKAVSYISESRPEGHFLNPTPPEPNVILPEEAMLVRASAPDASTHKTTLLRSGLLPPDATPELLLRAASSAEPAGE